LRFTNKFPSHLPEAILGAHLKSAIRNYALLFFGCLLLHVAGTWSLPLIDRDEPRFAEASREMIERGDYVVPHFNNQIRLDKPPLTYWLQTASYRLFGENDFAARFPSAVAAALVALSIFGWGSRLRPPRRPSASQARIGGTNVGWWAAIIFTLSLQTFLHAKAAVADMWLVLFMTTAHWSGYELLHEPSGHRSLASARPAVAPYQQTRWWWVFYCSLAFAFLAKGPIGWIPLLTVGSTMFFVRETQLARRFKFARGVLLTLAIAAIWGVPALIQTHGEFFTIGIGRHVVSRSFVTMEGHGANSFGMYLLLLPFYFVTIFISFFPWSIKLPWLTRILWRSRITGITDPGHSTLDHLDKYLIAGTAIIFIIFTLIKTKLPHYTLPAVPLLALLLARRLITENSTRFLRNCAAAFALAYLALALIVPPLVAGFFPAYELFRESRGHLRSTMEFGAISFNEPSLVWYFRSRVHGFLTPLNTRRAADFMAQTGPRFVIVPTSLTTKLFPNHPEDWKMFSTRGFNIAKGEHVELTLLLKSD
jgi:4-amino-4-deoxy-L-arabinose transferase-like glycosyltransferase